MEYDDPYNPEFNRIYDSLCVANKDTRYSAAEKRYNGDQFKIPAVYRRMTLSVTSDTDYDAAHPAGTPLDDLLKTRVYFAKEIVESGYDFKQYPAPDYITGHTIMEPLSEFNAANRKLVGGWFRFEFTKAPDATSTHRFTLVYRDEDGRELTAKLNPVTI